MLGKYWVPSREKLVQEIQFDAIIEALSREFDVVIDNTNLNNKVLDQFNRLIKTFEDYEIEYKDFFDTPLSVCIERDKNRDLQVTEKVIRSFYNNYKDKYPLNGN
jgi:predicted kinase